MIERGLIITGSDAELLDRALSEVKTKAYEESKAQLDDAQALDGGKPERVAQELRSFFLQPQIYSQN
jgi:hypothetical protein